MSNSKIINLSVVIPVYNESAGIESFNNGLIEVLRKIDVNYEVIYCNDGSTDDTAKKIKNIIKSNDKIKLLSLSRNFGKEWSLTAGLQSAKGDIIVSLDGDGQHPVELIPEFISKWRDGAQVVIGIRTNPSGKGLLKNTGPKIFNKIFNLVTGQQVETGTSDFQLITKNVQQAFMELNENERVTRDLIDWLGFKREYIHYKSNDRIHGTATYSSSQLLQLAVNSFISSSPRPLYLFGYLGIIISAASFFLGSLIIIEQLILDDPLSWDFSGTAMLGVLIIFLVGIVLMSQGILSLYISRIHTESKRRPVYIVDKDNSIL